MTVKCGWLMTASPVCAKLSLFLPKTQAEGRRPFVPVLSRISMKLAIAIPEMNNGVPALLSDLPNRAVGGFLGTPYIKAKAISGGR
jgi:hypothetical protein